jgi:hypothetical protein
MSAAEDLVARTCAAQGLPTVVDDPAVLDRVAALLGPVRASTPAVDRGAGQKTSVGRAGTKEVVNG